MRKLLNLKKIFIFAMILAIGALLYFEITVFAPSRLQTSDYTIENASIPSDFNAVTIAVFSDVYGDIDKLNKAVERMKMRNPDLIVFLGNLVGEANDETIQAIRSILSDLRAPLGKYAILGSNDTSHYETVISVLEYADFRLSQNKAVSIHNFTEASIQLLFLDQTNTEQSISDILETIDDHQFTITFMNNPKIVEQISGKNLTVALAGETLGGKVNVPFIGSLFFKDTYTKSNIQVGNTQLLLSQGISTPEPKLRLFADPNIIFVTLTASE